MRIKVVTESLNRRDMVQKSFLVSFVFFISVFLIVSIWQDFSDMDITAWIILIVFSVGVSFILAVLNALTFWRLMK